MTGGTASVLFSFRQITKNMAFHKRIIQHFSGQFNSYFFVFFTKPANLVKIIACEINNICHIEMEYREVVLPEPPLNGRGRPALPILTAASGPQRGRIGRNWAVV
ncbi:MAG: hypothetical protein LUE61_02335 [Clostridiales bacterium]|nr:hypothetical protein [Clostridiales bacterium]